MYTEHLQWLQRPHSPTPHGFTVGNQDDDVPPLQAPAWAGPLQGHPDPAWAGALEGHPDPEFTEVIVQGLNDCFRIGFDRASPLIPADRNMPSATEHDDVVSDYIDAELRKKHFLGPYSIEEFAGGQINRIGAIPKPPGNGE